LTNDEITEILYFNILLCNVVRVLLH